MMEQIACSKLALDDAITTKLSSTHSIFNPKKKIKVTEQEERLSALPDAILHHILSFLDMQEVVDKSILSKRWRYLWTSVPCLNFYHYRWEKITTKRKDKRMLKNGFMNFVDRVLFLRDASNISKMVLSCENYCDAQRVDAWLTIAARRHVKEIQLRWIPGIEPVKQLPHFIFTAAVTVFDLKLSGDYGDCGTVQLPDSMCTAPHLKTLKLKYAKLPKGNSTGELSLTCPVLENLAIIACQHGEFSILNINTPHLRNLVVRNFIQLSGNWTNGSCKIKICTPHLESLKISGSLYKQYTVEVMSSSLLTAEVHFPVPVVLTQSLTSILRGIRHAKSIILSGLELEKPQDVLDRSVIVFENLKCLKLAGCPSARSLSDMLHLLRNSPSIETLVIETYQMKEMLDWGIVLLPSTFFQVQNVEIGRFRGREDEYKFVEHLLKNAVSLETLTIKFEQYGCNRESVLPKFGSRIKSLPRASSSSIAIILI